jgi:hypothetical protein
VIDVLKLIKAPHSLGGEFKALTIRVPESAQYILQQRIPDWHDDASHRHQGCGLNDCGSRDQASERYEELASMYHFQAACFFSS